MPEFAAAGVMALLFYAFYREHRKSYLLQWALAWSALALFDLVPEIAAAGYLHLAFLFFGVWELVRRRQVRIRRSRFVLGATILSGTALSFLPFAAAIYAVVAASALLIAGATLLRVHRRPHGFTLLASALFAYAIAHLARVTTSVRLGPADVILVMAIGLGMFAALFDDQREASELATSEIEHLAYHDALTGMPNRPLFIDRLIVALAQAARAHQKLAVFFLDLDRFKDINDSLGHSVGDVLIKAVADRIRHCVREGDTVARFGGDEFTILVPKIDRADDAARIAQKIIETLRVPFIVGERELFVTASAGISVYPIDGLDPETLVRNADTAMYRAKDQGRDGYQLYAPAMNARALERLALENMLRRAITNNELVIHYQPLIDIETKAIVGMEALLRWQHPELGLLSPAHFISVAELSGLIIPIGEWVLRTACRQAKTWQRRLGEPIRVAVNLSARQFQQHDLIPLVTSALDDSGLNPECLELEITESGAMQNAENTSYVLRELKAAGVRISIDDFGTGYSSLNYLKRFPFDTLKLDQSFVHDVVTDPTDAAIVSAVITMAHSLNLQVVAEGVETEAQLAFLRRQGCDCIQGFLFSGPLTAHEAESKLFRPANAS